MAQHTTALFVIEDILSYLITALGEFNWSNTRLTYYYLVICNDCGKTSFHLSDYKLGVKKQINDCAIFTYPPKQLVSNFSTENLQITKIETDIEKDGKKVTELDELFFYHQPTTFFTIDDRIPKSIREPLSEADNCLRNNLLTGASACLRKSIYKLLKYETIPEKQQNEFIKYSERIDLLVKKYPQIDSSLFVHLKTLHELTSQELHENDWKDFDSATLRFLLEITKVILTELYVAPDEKKKRNKKLSDLQTKAKADI